MPSSFVFFRERAGKIFVAAFRCIGGVLSALSTAFSNRSQPSGSVSSGFGFFWGSVMKKPKSKTIPIPGNLDHNLGFHTAIGSLIIGWANTESIYLLYLQILLNQDRYDAAIIWYAQKSTHARLVLISQLARSLLCTNTDLLVDLLTSVSNFRGFCHTRNFFCHALYTYDTESKLDFAHGVTLTQDDIPLNFEKKSMNAETANEIIDAANRLIIFNDQCWDIAERLDQHFETQHAKRPQRRSGTST